MKRSYEDFLGKKAKPSQYKSDTRFIKSASEIKQKQLTSDNPTAYSNNLSTALFREKKVITYTESLRNSALNSIQHEKTQKTSFSFNVKHTISEEEIPRDFYSNILDWGKDGYVYFATQDLFAYNALTNNLISLNNPNNQSHTTITAMCSTPGKILYSADDAHTGNEVLISRDIQTCKNISGVMIPADQQSYIIRNKDFHVFYAGNSRGLIGQVDFRNPAPLSYIFDNDDFSRICSMSLCGDLIATGDDADMVRLWDIRKPHTSLMTYNMHKAAVKALAFSPDNLALLASGGGTADPTLYITDINQQKIVHSYLTDSQICNLHWVSKHNLLTTHGFGNTSKIKYWKMYDMKLEILASSQMKKERYLYSTTNPKNPNEFFSAVEGKRCVHFEIKEQQPHVESKIFNSRLHTIR